MTERENEELLSAVLDGVATAADVERVNSDAELRNQLASLRATRAALVAPTSPVAAVRERMIDAAMAEYAQLNVADSDNVANSDDGASAGSTPVASLDQARRSRARRSQRFNRVAMAAASVAVVVGGVALATNSGSNITSDTAGKSSSNAGSDAVSAEALEPIGSDAADDATDSEMMALAAPAADESFDRIEADEDTSSGGGLTQDAREETAGQTEDEMAADQPAQDGSSRPMTPEVENALAPCRPALDEQFGALATFEADLPADPQAWEFDVISPSGERMRISLDLESCLTTSIERQP